MQGPTWTAMGPGASTLGGIVAGTWFMVATSAAWVQKQSCTETKVRPFLQQGRGFHEEGPALLVHSGPSLQPLAWGVQTPVMYTFFPPHAPHHPCTVSN